MGTVKKVYILHGWTTSLDQWEKFLHLLPKVKLEPLMLKIPGLTEKSNKSWDLESYVEWLKKKLSGEKELILIGHSSGGRMALTFAAKYPGRIKQLILIDSAGIYHNELSTRFKRFVFKNLAKLGKKITKSETLKNLLYKLAREKDYHEATALQRRIMINLISEDLTPILEKITAPTLLIWGEFDKTTPLSDGKLMHQKIKNSKLYVIKGARHSPQFTHPNEVVKEIYEYL